MGGYEKGIFCQGSFNKRLSTRDVGVRVGLVGHPGGLFDFDGVVVEVTKAVEGLAFRLNAD